MNLDLDRLLPNALDDLKVSRPTVGDHDYPVLVVDNFFRDPGHVRALGMSLRYRAPDSVHPGFAAPFAMNLQPIAHRVHHLCGVDYHVTEEALERQCTSLHFFRVGGESPADAPRPAIGRPHTDRGLLVGLVYLNQAADCAGGTSFFRHRPTGACAVFPKEVMRGRLPDDRKRNFRWRLDLQAWDRMWPLGASAPFERAVRSGRCDHYDRYHDDILVRTPGDASGYLVGSCGDWEMTGLVEMRWNRLVLFPGFLLHSGHLQPDWFVDTPNHRRLTLNFMFRWPGVYQ
jgi:hypothetical protein